MLKAIILTEIENEGNLGAVARVMANFDCKELYLLRPRCSLTEEVRKRAKHAAHIIDNAKIIDDVSGFDTLIATTAKVGTDYNMPRTPITPEELAEKDLGNAALWIGREGDGLTNEEIRKADFTVTIPSSKDYPTLNISHAVGILLYEIFKDRENVMSHIKRISRKEKEELLKEIYKTLDKFEGDKKETQKILWKRLINKADLTRREAYALFGYFKK